jgi:hypothetical protein
MATRCWTVWPACGAATWATAAGKCATPSWRSWTSCPFSTPSAAPRIRAPSSCRARLVELMRPDGVAAVMFSNGGSDAVEGALKIARQYHKLRGEKRPHQVHCHAPGLPRRALRRHERQRQHQLPAQLRAAAAGRASTSTAPGCTATPMCRELRPKTRPRWAASWRRSWSARSFSRGRTPWPPSLPSRSRVRAA